MIAMGMQHALIQLAAFCVSVTLVSLEVAPAAPVSGTMILVSTAYLILKWFHVGIKL